MEEVKIVTAASPEHVCYGDILFSHFFSNHFSSGGLVLQNKESVVLTFRKT